MSGEDAWQHVENILCIRMDSLGDVLMTTPAIRALKEAQLGRRITLLTSTSGAAIASLIPEIDETVLYDPPWMKATQAPNDSRAEFEMIERLKAAHFDAAVIFTTFSQSPLPAAFLTFLAEIPIRLAHCRENPYHLLTHWVSETEHFGQSQIRHETRRQLDLVATAGAHTTNEHLSLQVSSTALNVVHDLLRQICLDVNKPWLVIHPGATAPSRRYAPESFAQVAQQLESLHNVQILFTGTQPEIGLVESIRSAMESESFSLAGRLNVEQFAALISIAPLLISNNTGPVHIAAALGTPVVDLYALTNPQHGPWQVPHRLLFYDVPCKFCYKSVCPLGHSDCLRRVSPDSVVEAALDLLAEVRV